MTEIEYQDLMFLIFAAGYQKAVDQKPLASAFREFLDELHQAHKEASKMEFI